MLMSSDLLQAIYSGAFEMLPSWNILTDWNGAWSTWRYASLVLYNWCTASKTDCSKKYAPVYSCYSWWGLFLKYLIDFHQLSHTSIYYDVLKQWQGQSSMGLDVLKPVHYHYAVSFCLILNWSVIILAIHNYHDAATKALLINTCYGYEIFVAIS